MSLLGDRATRLFLLLAAFFAVNAVLANLIGVKIFALEDTLGLAPFAWSLFGQSGSLSFTAGVLVWPLIFVLTDLVNEFYGRRGVRFISLLSVGLILYAFAFAYAYRQAASRMPQHRSCSHRRRRPRRWQRRRKEARSIFWPHACFNSQCRRRQVFLAPYVLPK